MITTDRLRADLDNAAAGTPVAAPDIPTLIGRGRRRRRQRRALLAGVAAVAVVAVAAGAGALATRTRHGAAPLPPAASGSPAPLTTVPTPPAALVRVATFDVAAWPSQAVAYDRTHHRYRYFPHVDYALPAPVGTRILLMSYEKPNGSQDVSMYDTATGTSRPVPVGSVPGGASGPEWSPDGSKLVFSVSDPKSGAEPAGFVVVDAATLTAHTEMLPASQYPMSASYLQWAPDGTHLVAGVSATAGATQHLQLFTVDGKPAGVVPASVWAPAASEWSPDRGRFVSWYDTADKNAAGYAVFDATTGAMAGRLPPLAGCWWLDGDHLLLYSQNEPTNVSEVDTNGAVVHGYPVPLVSTRDASDLLLYPHR